MAKVIILIVTIILSIVVIFFKVKKFRKLKENKIEEYRKRMEKKF